MFFTLIPSSKNIKNGENFAYFGMETLFLEFYQSKVTQTRQTKFQKQ